MIEYYALELPLLERFLERHRSGSGLESAIDVGGLLQQILQRANEFVPSESGSILLDDPFQKVAARKENELVFIATFGESAEKLLGRRLSATHGIVGRVYQLGRPYISRDVTDDEFFFPKIDQMLGHQTQAVVCVPIYIGKHVCGVLELINKVGGGQFTDRDMTLLEIFAGYTSFTLQNALDARRAHELARRDDLTGLYNDRWFNVRLSEALSAVRQGGGECVLIFMDLDNFKSINDCHGHLAGSQVLKEVGFLLKRLVEVSNATVARYGGDEFVAILPETTLDAGVAIAEKIRSSIAGTTFLDRPYGLGMPALNLHGILSASIGVARFVRSGAASVEMDKNDFLRRADSAMYRAKSYGKNKVVISDDLAHSPARHSGI